MGHTPSYVFVPVRKTVFPEMSAFQGKRFFFFPSFKHVSGRNDNKDRLKL